MPQPAFVVFFIAFSRNQKVFFSVLRYIAFHVHWITVISSSIFLGECWCWKVWIHLKSQVGKIEGHGYKLTGIELICWIFQIDLLVQHLDRQIGDAILHCLAVFQFALSCTILVLICLLQLGHLRLMIGMTSCRITRKHTFLLNWKCSVRKVPFSRLFKDRLASSWHTHGREPILQSKYAFRWDPIEIFPCSQEYDLTNKTFALHCPRRPSFFWPKI